MFFLAMYAYKIFLSKIYWLISPCRPSNLNATRVCTSCFSVFHISPIIVIDNVNISRVIDLE